LHAWPESKCDVCMGVPARFTLPRAASKAGFTPQMPVTRARLQPSNIF
jgi:hypothetical protein